MPDFFRRSMMGNFSIALSGLEADITALNTIGDNLANLNNTAYKEQSVSFEDLFHQQIGESGTGDPIQVGSGTKVGTTSIDFSEGTLLPDADENTSDMAIDGDGFFMLEQNGEQSLTRAGNFQLSPDGSLITSDGANVLGYPVVEGKIDTSQPIEPLQLPVGATQPAQASVNFWVTANLNSNAIVGSTFTTDVPLFDSLGQSYQATITYTKTAVGSWSYSMSLPPGAATGSSLNNTGTITFDSLGNMTFPVGAVEPIIFSGLTDGAADLGLSWKLGRSTGVQTISQFDSPNNITSVTSFGFPSGIYTAFTVDTNGTVEAEFSNKNTQAIGQLAVANVTNEQGLTAISENRFQVTASSGKAVPGVAGTSNRGTVADSTLEGSNVDISIEFTRLIDAQREFEANSKTLTTFNLLSEDILQMVK
jgi:flagellar hook protein FlgE